jgi:hypothetical protein
LAFPLTAGAVAAVLHPNPIKGQTEQ